MRRIALPVLLALAPIGCGTGAQSVDADARDGTDPSGPVTGAPSDRGDGSGDGSAADKGPLGCDAPSEAIRERALALINAVRAEARACGDEAFGVAAPLGWDDRLRAAAAGHSADMATHDFFSHTGSDGRSVADRVTAAGYAWSRVGENIAAGQRSVAEAVDGWVTSPGHCRNLMNPDYTAVALACVEDDGADYRTYWTNVLARPR